MENNSIKVYLADDHTVVRKGMVRLLSTFKRVRDVAEASNGKELIALIAKNIPDAVILDIEMPVMNGIDAASYIANHYPMVKMLALTMHIEDFFIYKLMDIGVNGFLSKSAEPIELEQALYSIVDHDFYKNAIVEKVLRKTRVNHDNSNSKLTSREMEILLLICQELTPGEISERINISEKTFFNHRSSILLKTNARSNVGLLRYALQRGYYTLQG
jgi:two-component system, NarL family, response regulator DegU